MSLTDKSALPISSDAINGLLNDTLTLVERGAVEGPDSMLGSLEARIDHDPQGSPCAVRPRWQGSESALNHAGWAVFGYVLLRDGFARAVKEAGSALTLFGLDAKGAVVHDILRAVPGEISRGPEGLRVWAGYPRRESEASGLLRLSLEGRPAGTWGWLSYGVARAALPWVTAEAHNFADFVPNTLGSRRWEALNHEAEARGLETPLPRRMTLPAGPFSRALVVAGTEGPVPGVPDQPNWEAYTSDLERAILDDPEMGTGFPF
jgi:hypothetical protein